MCVLLAIATGHFHASESLTQEGKGAVRASVLPFAFFMYSWRVVSRLSRLITLERGAGGAASVVKLE